MAASAWLALTAPATAVPPVAFDPGLEELAERARATGAVRVLVELEPRTAAGPATADPLAGEGVLARQDFATIPWLAATLDEAALRRLSHASGVRRVVEDRVAFPQGDLGALIGALGLHADGVDGRGQMIAILDVGFPQAHPAVASRIVDQACFSSDDDLGVTSLCRDRAPEAFGAGAFASCSGAVGCGHGLHVAGITAMSFVDGAGAQQTGLLDRSLGGWDAYGQPIRILWLDDIRSSRLVAPPPVVSGPRELSPGQSGRFQLAGTTT